MPNHNAELPEGVFLTKEGFIVIEGNAKVYYKMIGNEPTFIECKSSFSEFSEEIFEKIYDKRFAGRLAWLAKN
ncbi:MAG: hypothetical protein V1825_01690 [Candidatus Falkowbacteria bacterium]